MLSQILIATIVGSILSLAGGILLLWHAELAKKFSLILVGFAAGSLIGATFFELIPEVLEETAYSAIAVPLIAGIVVLLVFEESLQWYHCHNRERCDYHTFSSTVLFGDAIHNFVDGVAIALSFAVGTGVGVATTIAVFFHEIPQEIGDFGVLLYSGYRRAKVLWYNFLTALTAIAGAFIGYFLQPWIAPYTGPILAFIAGSFIYIAVSDLLPEIRHKTRRIDVVHLLSILAGLAVVWAVGVLLPE